MNEVVITVAIAETAPCTFNAETARKIAQSLVDKETEEALQSVLQQIETFANKGAFNGAVKAPIKIVDPWVIRQEVKTKLQNLGFHVSTHAHGACMVWEVSWK